MSRKRGSRFSRMSRMVWREFAMNFACSSVRQISSWSVVGEGRGVFLVMLRSETCMVNFRLILEIVFVGVPRVAVLWLLVYRNECEWVVFFYER